MTKECTCMIFVSVTTISQRCIFTHNITTYPFHCDLLSFNCNFVTFSSTEWLKEIYIVWCKQASVKTALLKYPRRKSYPLPCFFIAQNFPSTKKARFSIISTKTQVKENI